VSVPLHLNLTPTTGRFWVTPRAEKLGSDLGSIFGDPGSIAAPFGHGQHSL
jgi:hypothetical protein